MCHQCKLRKQKFFYGKVRKATSFLHSGKEKLLMLTLQNTWYNFFYLIVVYEVRWQIISLLRSLILVPALTVHYHTFTLYEGHVSLKVRVILDSALWVILWCARLLCGWSASSQNYWHRILPCQCSKQENRAKINGSGVKGQKDDDHSSGSWAFNPQTPNGTTSPIIQRSTCCLPCSKAQRHGNCSPSMGRTQNLLFPNLLMPGTRIF